MVVQLGEPFSSNACSNLNVTSTSKKAMTPTTCVGHIEHPPCYTPIAVWNDALLVISSRLKELSTSSFWDDAEHSSNEEIISDLLPQFGPQARWYGAHSPQMEEREADSYHPKQDFLDSDANTSSSSFVSVSSFTSGRGASSLN